MQKLINKTRGWHIIRIMNNVILIRKKSGENILICDGDIWRWRFNNMVNQK